LYTSEVWEVTENSDRTHAGKMHFLRSAGVTVQYEKRENAALQLKIRKKIILQLHF
jgi:hypothetical protein